MWTPQTSSSWPCARYSDPSTCSWCGPTRVPCPPLSAWRRGGPGGEDMATHTLDFERPLLELERQIEELKRVASETAVDVTKELAPLEKRLAELRDEIYKNLTPMQRVQVARHPKRPYTLDYLSTVFTDFVELHGDRLFRDDPAMEGGSGGALAVGLADRVLMLENSVYSVISPEGCAAILWKDASQRERAAEALKITAEDLLELGVIDEIIAEPPGGADAAALGETLRRHARHLRKVKIEKLLKRREEKYLSMGALSEK